MPQFPWAPGAGACQRYGFPISPPPPAKNATSDVTAPGLGAGPSPRRAGRGRCASGTLWPLSPVPHSPGHLSPPGYLERSRPRGSGGTIPAALPRALQRAGGRGGHVGGASSCSLWVLPPLSSRPRLRGDQTLAGTGPTHRSRSFRTSKSGPDDRGPPARKGQCRKKASPHPA